MRYKKILVNGRNLTAVKEVVNSVNRNGGNAQPELSFESMDKILKHMEENARQRIDIETMTTGYYPEIREPECGGNPDDGLVLAFGCWEVGNLEKFKSIYEQLKEINKDPELEPIKGIAELPSGYYLRAVGGDIYLCDMDGNTERRVMSLADAKLALANMEFRKSIVEPPKPGSVVITGTGDSVVLQYACQSLSLNEVTKVLEVLNQSSAKTEPVAG